MANSERHQESILKLRFINENLDSVIKELETKKEKASRRLGNLNKSSLALLFSIPLIILLEFTLSLGLIGEILKIGISATVALLVSWPLKSSDNELFYVLGDQLKSLRVEKEYVESLLSSDNHVDESDLTSIQERLMLIAESYRGLNLKDDPELLSRFEIPPRPKSSRPPRPPRPTTN